MRALRNVAFLILLSVTCFASVPIKADINFQCEGFYEDIEYFNYGAEVSGCQWQYLGSGAACSTFALDCESYCYFVHPEFHGCVDECDEVLVEETSDSYRLSYGYCRCDYYCN